MIAGLATHIEVNDHYILTGYGGFADLVVAPRQLATVLRKCDEIGEILTPGVFHAVGQDDNAFR
jgi:hypothetical protein